MGTSALQTELSDDLMEETEIIGTIWAVTIGVITANILQGYIYNVNCLTLLQSKPNAFMYNFSLAIYLSPKASFIVWVMYVIWLRPSKMRLRRS